MKKRSCEIFPTKLFIFRKAEEYKAFILEQLQKGYELEALIN